MSRIDPALQKKFVAAGARLPDLEPPGLARLLSVESLSRRDYKLDFNQLGVGKAGLPPLFRWRNTLPRD